MDDANKPVVAYVSESYGPHDHRFLTAIRTIGKEVWHIRTNALIAETEDRPTPVGEARTRCITRRAFASRVAELQKVITDIAPDIVHAGPLQSVTFPVVLATDVPVVAASWGSDLLGAAVEDPVWRDVAAFSLSRARAFLADCFATVGAASRLGYRGPSARIPWGVDVGRFSPGGATRRFAPQGDFVVLSTRNWEEVYDVLLVARAFADLAAELNLHLVLCGSGSLQDRLQGILDGASADGRVTWLGWVSQAMLPEVYRGADLYVSASKSDGSSVSLLEAMSCGRPVLVSDIPGNREWVDCAAHRFAVGDIEELKASLRRLARRPRADLEARGLAGRARILHDADWSNAAAGLARLYAEART